MFTEYFPHTTIHDIPVGMRKDYELYGSISLHCSCLELCATISPLPTVYSKRGLAVDNTPDKPTPTNVRRERPLGFGVRKRSYNFYDILKCIEIVDRVRDDEGEMTTILTRWAGVIDIETIATRYVLHFDSMHAGYIIGRLRELQVPHKQVDYHTIVVPRLKQTFRKAKK